MAIRSLSALFAPVTNQLANTPTDSLHREVDSDVCDPVVRKSVLGRFDTRRLGKLLAAGLLSAVVCGSSGCSMMSGACRAVKHQDGLDSFMIKHRNKSMAAKAWFNEAHCFENCGNLKDIQAGYMQGYMDVAMGSDGCAPAVAPSSYWGWKYQSAGGQNSVNSWFQGYPLGVRAAERDGVGNWGQVRPNMSALQPREAVFVPPAASADEANAFYGDDQFPYEPEEAAEVQPALPDEVDAEADSPSDDPLGDPLGDGFQDEPMLEDAPERPGDVGDAIRDALDTPSDSAQAPIQDESLFDGLDGDDSGQVFGGDVSASEPSETGVRFSIDHDEVMERMFGDGSIPPTATSADPPSEELPYDFD